VEEGRNRLEMRSLSSWLTGSKAFLSKVKRRKRKRREGEEGEREGGAMPGVLLQGFSSVSTALLAFMHPARNPFTAPARETFARLSPCFSSSLSLSFSQPPRPYFKGQPPANRPSRVEYTREPAKFTKKKKDCTNHN
jgi:hypothetical protein